MEDKSFNPTLATVVDVNLSLMEGMMTRIIELANDTISAIEAEHDSLYDADNQGPFPLCANLSRFESLFHWSFNERTKSLPREIETLRKEWQLKVGTFNPTSGKWEYK